jgi:hypothetical protein
MSEKGSEPDIQPRRFNVAEVPGADIRNKARSGRSCCCSDGPQPVMINHMRMDK